jgi:hypothetical protein
MALKIGIGWNVTFEQEEFHNWRKWKLVTCEIILLEIEEAAAYGGKKTELSWLT